MQQYKTYNIKNTTDVELTEPLNKFRQITFTNTSNIDPVTFDLYVTDKYQDPNKFPSQEQYFLLKLTKIPVGVSLTIGSEDIPYLIDNVRKVYLKSHSTTGDLTVIIK